VIKEFRKRSRMVISLVMKFTSIFVKETLISPMIRIDTHTHTNGHGHIMYHKSVFPYESITLKVKSAQFPCVFLTFFISKSAKFVTVDNLVSIIITVTIVRCCESYAVCLPRVPHFNSCSSIALT
jgi:hypothetical protein